MPPEPEDTSSLVRTFAGGLFALSFCACLAKSPSDGVSCPRPGAQTASAKAQNAIIVWLRGMACYLGCGFSRDIRAPKENGL